MQKLLLQLKLILSIVFLFMQFNNCFTLKQINPFFEEKEKKMGIDKKLVQAIFYRICRTC